MALSLDFTNMMGTALPHGAGISAAQWSAAAAGFASVHARVHSMQQELGFLTLPRNDALRDATLAVAAPLRGHFDDVLLLGIGGSALGPIALRTALRPPAWNALSADARGNAPRLHVLDNVDPATIAATLHRLHLSRTLVLVVSKSGGTVETMAQYLIVRQALADAVGEEAARAHLVFVTDPEVGALRTIARGRHHDARGTAQCGWPLLGALTGGVAAGRAHRHRYSRAAGWRRRCHGACGER